MVSRGDTLYAVYPCYFDRERSREQGRRVSKNLAVEKPTIEAIAKAARALGLTAKIEKAVKHPSTPFRVEGRVLIDKEGPKTELLRSIAERL